GKTAANVMASLMTREPPLPSSLNKDLDPDLEKIVLKALERDPSKRFQSAGQLRDALNAYRKGESGLLERLVPSPVKKKPNKLIPLAAGVGLVLVISVMGFLLFGPKEKSEQTSDIGAVAKVTPSDTAEKGSPAPEQKAAPRPANLVEKAPEPIPKPAATVPIQMKLDKPVNLAVDTTKNTLEVEGTVEPSNAKITISGKSIPVKDGRFSSPVNLPEGRSSIKIVASVEGQADKSMIIKVTCDSVKPVINLIRPKAGIINYTNVRVGFLQMKFSEPIANIEINGKSPPLFKKRRRRIAPLDFRQKLALPEGRHEFSLVAIDYAGNRSLPAKSTLVIDLTSPKIVVDNTSFKNVDGVFEVTVRIEDKTPVKLTLGGKELAANDSNTYKVQFSPKDPNSTLLRAIDAAGNVTTKTLAPPLVLLRDHTKWSEASNEAQDLEIALVAQFLGEAFKRGDTQFFSCKKSKYRLAEFIHLKTGMVFHLLPGGTYSMGTNNQGADVLKKLAAELPGGGQKADRVVGTEQPQHTVTLPPFLIGRYEVSISQWKKIPNMGGNPSKGSLSRPMHDLSWAQAKSWCEKVGNGFRLPSESEWEYACRANTKTLYYWSDKFEKSYVWHRKPAKLTNKKRPKNPKPMGPGKGPGRRGPGMGPPGGLPRGPADNEGPPDLSDFKIKLQSITSRSSKDNGFGLVNMLGNVWEWCEDSYHTNYNGGPTNQEARRGIQLHVKRGGSVANVPLVCRPGFRDMRAPLPIPGPVGFRVAISLP
ncbi:MAG: SUMF1/EgtB/PvdO family nonheme iron enzyme, partial [Planctomycetota bacterium]|nr:SUMF1/EgtB/PvdO family nonheme iron enzyme [Planctomycetota bacterium]